MLYTLNIDRLRHTCKKFYAIFFLYQRRIIHRYILEKKKNFENFAKPIVFTLDKNWINKQTISKNTYLVQQ